MFRNSKAVVGLDLTVSLSIGHLCSLNLSLRRDSVRKAEGVTDLNHKH